MSAQISNPVARWVGFLVLSLAVNACGGSADQGNPPPMCSAASCVCPAGGACDFTPAACGGSCSLKCASSATCRGSCGESCSIDCSGMSSCEVTVGKSSSVTCTAGSTCRVTCTGSCSVSCGGGGRCQLKCSGDSGFREIAGGGSC